MAKAEHLVADTENPQHLEKAQKEVAMPKSRSVKGGKKSSRAQLLAFALGAPPTMSEDDENLDGMNLESSSAPAPNVGGDEDAEVVKVESVDANVELVAPSTPMLKEEMEALEAEAARLEAEALAAENEAQRLLDEPMAMEQSCTSYAKPEK